MYYIYIHIDTHTYNITKRERILPASNYTSPTGSTTDPLMLEQRTGLKTQGKEETGLVTDKITLRERSSQVSEK